MKEKSIPQFQKDISLKEQILNFSYTSIPLKKFDPILNILKNLDNISNNIYNIEKIFNILNYNILNNQKKRNLAKYFNIYLFIINNPTIIKNINDIKLILEMNSYLNDIKNESDKYKKIIISKIILELINIYKENIKTNDINDKIIEKIKNDNSYFFEKNFNILIKLKKNFNKENILSLKIEKIYRKSLLVLIKKYNYKKNENAYYNMAYQYEFDAINLSDAILTKIFDVLITKEYHIKKHIIKNIEDLFNINKINFYTLLLKYILKNPIYIYQIPFLLQTRKFILHFIKKELKKMFYLNINNNIKDKLCFVINIITDSKYYFNKFINYLKLKEIYDYYKEFCFKSKKKEIIFIENNIINNNVKIEDVNKNIFEDFHIAKKMNERKSIIKYLFISKLVNYEKELSNYIIDWDKLEQKINEKKYDKIDYNLKLNLSSYFLDENNKKELTKIFKRDIYNYIKDKSKDFLIQEKNNNAKKSNINDSKINSISNESKSKNKSTSIIIESNYIYNSSSFFDIDNFLSKDKTSELKFVKILGKHEKSAEFIKEVESDIVVSGGSDRNLYFYDNNFNLILNIKDTSIIYNIIKTNKSKNRGIPLLFCSDDKLTLIEINKKNQYNMKTLPNNSLLKANCLNILDFQNDIHIILTYDRVELLYNFYSKIVSMTRLQILKNTYKGAIIINNEIVIFTSNKAIPYGDDKLVVYNFICKKIIEEIIGYSFVKTVNGLILIQKLDNFGSLLLCACVKYTSDQKNGILVVNIGKKEENGKIIHHFYETDNYEVYCFCHIIVKEHNYILNDEKNKKYETECFLVGGFDGEKKSGKIKLYKFENDEEISEIKFINDIEFEDILEIKSPISCIHQFQNSENLLITTLDGNVYLYKLDLNYILSINAENEIDITI